MKRTGDLLLTVFLLLPLIPFASIDLASSPEQRNHTTTNPTSVMIPSYENFTQISINNNSDLSNLISVNGWPGDGSEGDPYRIQNLN